MKTREVIAVIPARFHSTRLPGKALLEIQNIPMIVHVLRRVQQARRVSRTLVATDDERIIQAVRRHGGEAVMTSAGHESGTDRVAEVARSIECDLVVNVQGDEPMLEPEVIDEAITAFDADPELAMSTTREPIESVQDVLNPNVVKVVTDERGFALYFSRSPVPYARSRAGLLFESAFQEIPTLLETNPALLSKYAKHTGLYVYRREVLLTLASLPPSKLEQMESLEQLRALEHGYTIRVVPVHTRSIGVDTEEDLQRVRELMSHKASFPA